jgi:hypothetical protein
MIQLTLSGAAGAPDLSLGVPHVRIFGGTVWDRVDLGVVATYSAGCWVRRSVDYQWILFEGNFRLLFGLIRDPSPISEPVQILTLSGPIMYLNDAPFAEYMPAMQMWRGTSESRLWWPSLHLTSADFVDSRDDATGAQRTLDLTTPDEVPPRRLL